MTWIMPSWVRDAVLAIRGGQLRGVSPGFQVTIQGRGKIALIPEGGSTLAFLSVRCLTPLSMNTV